jgi:hypothetical protein
MEMLGRLYDIGLVTITERFSQHVVKGFRVMPVVSDGLGKDSITPNLALYQALASILVVDADGRSFWLVAGSSHAC